MLERLVGGKGAQIGYCVRRLGAALLQLMLMLMLMRMRLLITMLLILVQDLNVVHHVSNITGTTHIEHQALPPLDFGWWSMHVLLLRLPKCRCRGKFARTHIHLLWQQRNINIIAA